MREKLLEILTSIRPDVDFEKEDNLIEDGLLNSLDIVNLFVAIEDEFDVKLRVADYVPENFKDVDAIVDTIKRVEEE